MPLISTPAILLRSHPYSETSRILRFSTPDFGVVAVVARGVRRSGAKGRAPLSLFAGGTLTVTYRESRDLQSYREFSVSQPRLGLGKHPLRLAAASLLSEVILLQASSERSPELFASFSTGLDELEGVPLEGLLQALLARLWSAVGIMGYAPVLEHCVSCGRRMGEQEEGRFDPGAGGVRCFTCGSEVAGPRLGPKARAQLQRLVEGRLEEKLLRPVAHLHLVMDFVIYHLSGGKPLRSLSVLDALLPKDLHA